MTLSIGHYSSAFYPKFENKQDSMLQGARSEYEVPVRVVVAFHVVPKKPGLSTVLVWHFWHFTMT